MKMDRMNFGKWEEIEHYHDNHPKTHHGASRAMEFLDYVLHPLGFQGRGNYFEEMKSLPEESMNGTRQNKKSA